ncbi:GNAT family N-acetyltransferase [Lipingzhangella sp. LS1_29]|uniref:GNAT family N-acetyltransferase n=1 Tax=Lipingzhangella rawalii TaxID=2055835 RepID=A0ABU2H8I0_9ACTN|nr:GNAT family N-acetyltransferase [Lipingzhangella rawalii]MDS1271164.1 GNAT family N-acetyltransferase [Lipingzhangella rawalii]
MQPYPNHWEADVVLTDGGTAHLRPITPDDADLLRDFHSRLSPETIYFRFFAPYPKLSSRDVERFTQVDYDDRVALVATIGDVMVAVVRYDRIDAESAEVAFVVADAHQGRGLASVLLEHIGAVARERGVRRFIADVLPENRRMVNVFREAGYTAQQTFDEGVLRLTLDLEPTEDAVEVMRAREQRAEARSISRLLTPASVAVIGASRAAHSIGQTALRNLLSGDFRGPVFPVHPQAPAVAGVRAYPSVLDIPDPVDLAVVAVPAEMVHDVVEQCATAGVHGLVVVSSGFAESDSPEGRERQEDLVRTARAAGLRVVGPNCLGIVNTDPDIRLNATLAADIPTRGPIGFFSQSGALGRAILQRVAQRGMGLSTFVSAGNRADVSGNDLIQYWEEDPATKVVLQYLESLGNPRKFTRLARRLAQHKPVVAVRSGGSSHGIPLGHAAEAVALPDYAVTSLFRQAGVVRVEDITQMFDIAQLFAYQPLPQGPRVAIVGNSDSLGLIAKDACLGASLRPREPIDLGPNATADDFDQALASVLADDTVDSVVVVFTPALAPITGDVAEVMRSRSATASKPIVTTYLGYQGLPEDLRHVDADGATTAGSIPSYPAPEDAARVLSHATRYAMWRRRDPGRHPELADIDRARARALITDALTSGEESVAPSSVWFSSEPSHNEESALSISATRELLACYGISMLPDAQVSSAEEAVAAAERIGYPVVVKADAPDLRMRAGGSGIRADLYGPDDVRGAFTSLDDRLGSEAMLVVQGMVDPGVPVVIRAGENPSFGSVVAFGLADVTAELLDDRAYRLAPLTDTDAADLVRAVRASPLLFGLPAGASSLAEAPDVEALEELLVRVSRLVDALPEVAHMDLHSVIVNASGAQVLGARVWLRPAPEVRLDHGPRRLRAPF